MRKKRKKGKKKKERKRKKKNQEKEIREKEKRKEKKEKREKEKKRGGGGQKRKKKEKGKKKKKKKEEREGKGVWGSGNMTRIQRFILTAPSQHCWSRSIPSAVPAMHVYQFSLLLTPPFRHAPPGERPPHPPALPPPLPGEEHGPRLVPQHPERPQRHSAAPGAAGPSRAGAPRPGRSRELRAALPPGARPFPAGGGGAAAAAAAVPGHNGRQRRGGGGPLRSPEAMATTAELFEVGEGVPCGVSGPRGGGNGAFGPCCVRENPEPGGRGGRRKFG